MIVFLPSSGLLLEIVNVQVGGQLGIQLDHLVVNLLLERETMTYLSLQTWGLKGVRVTYLSLQTWGL